MGMIGAVLANINMLVMTLYFVLNIWWFFDYNLSILNSMAWILGVAWFSTGALYCSWYPLDALPTILHQVVGLVSSTITFFASVTVLIFYGGAAWHSADVFENITTDKMSNNIPIAYMQVLWWLAMVAGVPGAFITGTYWVFQLITTTAMAILPGAAGLATVQNSAFNIFRGRIRS
jgi:hypothetical protein